MSPGLQELRAYPRAALVTDALLGVAVTLVVVLAISMDLGGARGPDPFAYAFALGFGALMMMRRTRPVLVLLFTSFGICVYYALEFPPIGLAVPVGAALYAAADAGRIRWAAGTLIALLAVSSYFRLIDGEDPGYLFGYEFASSAGLMAAAVALGWSVRTGRLLRNRQEQLDLLAEQEREYEAASRVQQERLRIARELHDAVGHTVSVISLHSDVAREALGRDDSVVADSLRHIREAAGNTMRELRSAVKVLRDPDESPGKTSLESLATAVRRAGIDVTVERDGGETSDATESVMYRIVQEALTNVIRHSHASRIAISLRHQQGELALRVADNGRGCPDVRFGHGLTGMRERAESIGGTLAVASGPEGFVVEAQLPAQGAT
ncbi:sensor histidine kinase [Hoyosella altamirensis]|uniref:histidine kinase n=1 Tax=Hoyosella altamirensis TaxID=616997 RepID=A0A839RHB7_9ACTN|nr:sensor histidine kinase [Hoyosella altamirensis]MBB3036005.1 signal transduction histidine kinase [Hoyosella altamirensis]